MSGLGIDEMNGLIEELSLGPARGGRRKAAEPVRVMAVRGLDPDDVELLANPPVVGSLPSIPQIRHQHHQLAGLMARGVDNAEISLITGFAPSYISMLRNAPDMKELIEYYSSQAEERTVDALARLRGIGIASVEELQHRLNEAPEKFSNAQLMDLIEVGLIKPASIVAFSKSGGPGGKGGGPGIQINLNFKTPAGAAEVEGSVLLEQAPK